MIGDDVEITVVDIRGDKVRLGIKAPPHIPVHRKEVYEAIKRENLAASRVSPDDLKSVATSRVPPTQKVVSPPANIKAETRPAITPVEKTEQPGSKPEGRRLPADSNNSKNNNSKSTNSSGCEGTQDL